MEPLSEMESQSLKAFIDKIDFSSALNLESHSSINAIVHPNNFDKELSNIQLLNNRQEEYNLYNSLNSMI